MLWAVLSGAAVLSACTVAGPTSGDHSSASTIAASTTAASTTAASTTPDAKTVVVVPATLPTVQANSAPADSPGSKPEGTNEPPTTVVATVTRTLAGTTRKVAPPPQTMEPTPVAGDCPYLDAGVVAAMTGQHHGQTEVIQLHPQPMCVFYRSDGRWLGSVRIIQAADPATAAAAVNQHAPIDISQPAGRPQGWSGGSTTTGRQTEDADAKSVYAVSKGSIAVVAQENEAPSLKARTMAVCAIYNLKLQAGTAPDYCLPVPG